MTAIFFIVQRPIERRVFDEGADGFRLFYQDFTLFRSGIINTPQLHSNRQGQYAANGLEVKINNPDNTQIVFRLPVRFSSMLTASCHMEQHAGDHLSPCPVLHSWSSSTSPVPIPTERHHRSERLCPRKELAHTVNRPIVQRWKVRK